MSLKLIMIITILLIASFALWGKGRRSKTSEEFQIGVMVKEIDSLLYNYPQPDAFETIAEYGTDSRYYVMIRGWLVQELAGAESLMESTKNREDLHQKHVEKVIFLRKLIRRIDLE